MSPAIRLRTPPFFSSVVPPPSATDRVLDVDKPPPPIDETRLERLAKLIPGDVVSVYVAAIGLGKFTTWPSYTLAVAIGCTVLVPLLLYLDARPTGKVPATQYVVRTLAFVAWAFAISQPLSPWAVTPIAPALIALLLPVIGERLIH